MKEKETKKKLITSRPKSTKYLLTTAEGYREWSRYLDREWMPALSPSEYSCVRFIFDRTVGWKKRWERITLRHFYEGVFTKENVFWGATNLSRRTVVNVLAKLRKKGVIKRSDEFTTSKFRDGSHLYSLNYDWKPPRQKRMKPKNIPLGSPKDYFDFTGENEE